MGERLPPCIMAVSEVANQRKQGLPLNLKFRLVIIGLEWNQLVGKGYLEVLYWEIIEGKLVCHE